ncbi:MAG: NAD-glutamate dehydrogenase [Magnetovibrio sp.]|nr:NAD-glutamate dehydrogenase [Magnetovibrio sp.]|tara:strand:- start:5073 stop:9938 length:4866 start_codon:yes stop_codon:yes gene_type:complete
MPIKRDLKTDALLKQVSKLMRGSAKGAKATALVHYADQYFAHMPPMDIHARDAETLAGIAKSHWKTAAQHKPGKPSVRAYKPDAKKDGWTANRTVVDIVTEDMPFLVDSVSSEMNRRGLTVHLVVHPILKVKRDTLGRLQRILDPGEPENGARLESWMHIEVDEETPDGQRDIEKSVLKVLDDVRLAVQDWRPMRERMARIIDDFRHTSGPAPLEEANEVREFLRWIHDNNFTFLGSRDYKISGTGPKTSVAVDKKSALGILRDLDMSVLTYAADSSKIPPEVRAFISDPGLIVVTKSNQRSTVHRPVHMDAIGIKSFDKDGKVVGLRIFVGLFTSAAYNRSPRDIPLLRRRLQQVLERAGLPPGSHDGKAMTNILETYPRDELFQISEEQLLETAMGILHLQDRQRVALFMRQDNFGRFVSCMIYVPRDRYTMNMRERMQDILCEALNGRVSNFSTTLGDAPLARVYLIIATEPGKLPAYYAKGLENKLTRAARTWADDLAEALTQAVGEKEGLRLTRRFQNAFGPGYTAQYSAEDAVTDIEVIEESLTAERIGLHLYRPEGAPGNQVRFKVYHPGTAVPLSDALPVFEHMGFRVIDENPHEVSCDDGNGGGVKTLMIHDFGLETRDGGDVDIPAIKDKFEDAFARVWRGEIESDGFNALVARGGLDWREVLILRAYCRCLRQMGIPYSQTYMEQTLAKHLGLANMIVQLFMVRMAISKQTTAERDKKAAALHAKMRDALEAVTSADEDRILTRFINLVDATLRTNFFQPAADGGDKPYVSFKFNSRLIDDLPKPRPLREIFVYSPRVEGVHLRFGFVARGGLRWSDRPEDFRTEILGLVKAQQVKNAVIVPVGSKGGFVVKRPPTDGGRDAFMAEGIECYKTLIRGLLDVTDNLKGTRVVPPKSVYRWDDDDPYLVVAADKGTATFSDIANGVSMDYGHWLGDAFASGGSVGYDHKGMGITAKGAWESVKRHFREIGTDIQNEDFTVVGVGDMSGDVFGNGMMLSKHIKLQGAFNHMHIFVDPDPDPAKTHAERVRLFNLGRSSWSDYDIKKISKGGGIYERSAKTIKLSPEARACFGLTKDTVSPNELIQAMLRAPVDLLWFGGIGTYIKGQAESSTDVGDRANDAIRINGQDIQAKVVGEGANLGATQKGRIEYAMKGGRLNTDSIDNSAGVDCSDHEVNIKVLLGAVVAKGGLTEAQRNKLLARMTDEVGELVLKHNYNQTQAISSIQAKGAHTLDNQIRLMRLLEKRGLLERAVEFLPDDEQLSERAAQHKGLTRPELSVMIAYAKNWLYDELLKSDLPDDPFLLDEIVQYFPSDLRQKYLPEMKTHRLKREIIATRVTNSMVNRVGDTFVTEFMEKTGRQPAEIARAYTIAREVLRTRLIWAEIEALDNKVPTRAQTSMLADLNRLLEWVTLWFLRNGKKGLDIGAHVAEFGAGMAELADHISAVVPKHYIDDMKNRAKPYLDDGVPTGLAHKVAHLVNLYSAPDIVGLANRRKMDVREVAKVYFALGTRFRLGRLRAAASNLESEDHWQQLAVAALVEEVYSHQLALASNALDHLGKAGKDTDKAIAAWVVRNQAAVDQTEVLLNELWTTEVNDLSMVAVASRQLRALADAQA